MFIDFLCKCRIYYQIIVFEITPKEQLLKNIRKGLVQPLPNKYPLLNSDKEILKKTLLLEDEDFIKNWVEKGYFFNTFKGYHDLFNQMSGLQETYGIGLPGLDEKVLVDLLNDNNIPFVSIDKLQKTILLSVSKIESTSNCICVSSEIQPVKFLKQAEYLILFGKASQIESPVNNRFLSDVFLKNELRIQLHIDYFENFGKVFLFIEE